MLLLNSVEPEKWYTISEAEPIIGYGRDAISDRIKWGLIQAQFLPGPGGRRKRKRGYNAWRIQGCEIIRYVKEHMTPLQPNAVIRRRIA